jgi:hypothetical protein
MEMQKSFFKAIALTAILSLTSTSMGFAAGGSIGLGDISVYKNGQVVSELSGQNPLEDGSLLVCKSKCMIKSEGISLIGADSVKMAVTNEQDVFKLYVQEGKVDYIINTNVRKISFFTPQGTYTLAEAIFNAGSQSVVKGSVVVDSDGKTEIAVTEGRLVFTTSDGLKTVDANNKIVLAMLPPAPADDAGGAAETGAADTGAAGTGELSTGTIVAIAGGAVAVGGIVALAAGGGGGGGSSSSDSPASPSN